MSQIRHPAKKKNTFPPTPHTLISNGNDRKILEGMHKFKDTISNTRRFSNDIKIPRSTVKDILKELINKGYVEKPVLGVYILTNKGKQLVSAISGVADSSVGEWRTGRRKRKIFNTLP